MHISGSNNIVLKSNACNIWCQIVFIVTIYKCNLPNRANVCKQHITFIQFAPFKFAKITSIYIFHIPQVKLAFHV